MPESERVSKRDFYKLCQKHQIPLELAQKLYPDEIVEQILELTEQWIQLSLLKRVIYTVAGNSLRDKLKKIGW